MKRKLITEIAGYAYATIDLYAATHSEFHRGQMLAYINALDAVGGRAAKRLQGELKNVYNDWIDALIDALLEDRWNNRVIKDCLTTDKEDSQ